MQITETQKDYEVFFTYNPDMVKAVKDIDGSWFNGRNKTWHIPKFRKREINFLRQKFNVSELKPVQVDIPSQENYDDIPELPDLDVELPLLRKPFPYQAKGIAYGRINKRIIIGDQPGLGKTLQAIGIVSSFGITNKMLNAGPGLIICPSSLKINWQKEWMVNAGHRSMILTDSIKNTWQQYYNVGMCDVFIVNYESLKKFFIQPGWKKPAEGFKMNQIPFRDNINIFKWVIIDESHKCKEGNTQQTKFVMGIARGKEIVLELTGTPILNQARDLITQLHIIDRLRDIVAHIPRPVDAHGKQTDYSGYTRFVNRYCGGGNESTNLKELNYRLYKYCFFRREKSEVLKDLPAKIRQVVRSEITNRQEYDRAENEFVKYLKEVKGCTDQEVAKKLRGQMMVKIGILKQISARGKIEAAQEFIQEVIDGGQKIVVFVHLKESAAAIKQVFPGAVSITGDDNAIQRDTAITKFQKHPETKIIVCSLQAGGVGITLTASSEVLFIEFPWTFALCEQAEDRTHRIGQDNNVRATYLLGDQTIDEYCYEIIQKKKSISQEVTGASDDVVEEMIDNLLNLFNQK